MRRRQFITLLGGAAALWPLAARAQQPDRMRRVGALMNTAADSADGQARFAAFVHGLQQLGWTEGRNARLDGPRAIPNAFADTRRSWSRWRPTSSWPLAGRT